MQARQHGELLPGGVQGELHKTTVMVTHDIEEAIRVGDLVALYRPGGHLAQVDTPERLLGAPAPARRFRPGGR